MNIILRALHHHLQQHYHNITYHHTNQNGTTLIIQHKNTTLHITQQEDTLHLTGHNNPNTTISLHDPQFLQKIHQTIQNQ